jgi:hypothetical protein
VSQRRRIVAAAVHAFAPTGYGHPQRADIAEQASMPASTIEHHFHNQEELFSAALWTVMAHSTEAIAAALAGVPIGSPLCGRADDMTFSGPLFRSRPPTSSR